MNPEIPSLTKNHKTIVRSSAAIASAAALLGPASLANTAQAHTGDPMPDAETAAIVADPNCPLSAQAQEAFYCDWRVERTIPLDTKHRHDWILCVAVAKSNQKRQLSCSISDSKSTQTTAEVSGQFPVGIAALSATVGYNVTETRTAEGSVQVPVKKNKAGGIYWAPIYSNRFRVIQRLWACNRPAELPGTGDPPCRPRRGKKKYVAKAVTEKFEAPIFKYFPKGKEPQPN